MRYSLYYTAYFGGFMMIFNIGDKVELNCRGVHVFIVVYVGKFHLVVEDIFGNEVFVRRTNIKRRL